jgi:hypothetical protein
VDATEANLPGVPQPEQTLDSHIATFARQGFTQDEMIGLVACGWVIYLLEPPTNPFSCRHTFGGVQHDAFPNIVPELNDPSDTESVAHFDSTNTHFDNNMCVAVLRQIPHIVTSV